MLLIWVQWVCDEDDVSVPDILFYLNIAFII